jgi:steroid delta-isomerase-like uncharacterized protein
LTIKEAVRKELEALNRQDVEGVMAFYTEDVIFEDISLPEPLSGSEEMREFMEGMYATFPDLHVELQSLFGEDEIVAAEYQLIGTHEGDLDGKPPTGKTFRVKALSVYEYDGQRFTKETFYWDSASMLQQLGLA